MIYSINSVSQCDDLLSFLPEAYSRFVHRAAGFICFQVRNPGRVRKGRMMSLFISPVHKTVKIMSDFRFSLFLNLKMNTLINLLKKC